MSESAPSPSTRSGELLVLGDVVTTLPLTYTEVHGQVIGMLASVALTQHFANPFDHPIDLLYRFAIPDRASVVGLEIQVGDRRIEGEVAAREEAEHRYEEAVAAGQRAALTTEERPNLYTVRLGNVLPGESIKVTYRYSLRLEFESGRFELTLPFGITPRYHRADESEEDVRRTSVAIAPPDAEVGDLDVTITIDAGVPIALPRSPSHQIDVTRLDDRRCVARLVHPRLPNKDFVLRYDAEATDLRILSSAWRARHDDGDYVYALFVPPPPGAAPERGIGGVPQDSRIPGGGWTTNPRSFAWDTASADLGDASARELVFVLDRSGSMSGEPIAQARNALRACLRTLGTADTFRILLFDDEVEWYQPRRHAAQRFTDESLRAADRFLDGVEGRGGTELLPALEAVADLPPDPERQRVVVLFTDGAVSAENRIADFVRQSFPRVRFFCFGIGPSVNRYLLKYLARASRGVAEFVGLDEDIEEAIIRFQDRLSYPLVSDLELDAAGLEGVEAHPSPLPDLYAGQVMHIAMRLPVNTPAEIRAIRIRGQRAGATVELVAPCVSTTEPIVRRLWAQERINALLEEPGFEPDNEAVVALSLQYQVLTPHTAFVAVDRSVAADRPARRVVVATPLPEGLDRQGFGVSFRLRSHVSPPAASPPSASFLLRAGSSFLRRIESPAPDALYQPRRSEPTDAPAADAQIANDRDDAASSIPSVPRSREQLLRALAREQSASGAWTDERRQPSVELTAAAVVAFARGGHTPRQGMFRRPLARALAWLRQQARNPLERLYLLWVLAEAGAESVQWEQVVEASDRVHAEMPDAADLADALRARIRAELQLGDSPAGSANDRRDSRLVAIAGLRPHDEDAVQLALPWRACFADE